MTEPENKKYSSQSLNLTSTKPVKDTKVTTTCVGASVVKKTKTNVKTNLVDEPHTKKSKKSDTKVSMKFKKTLKFPQFKVSKTTNFTPSDELTYLTQFSKKALVLSNDVIDSKEKDGPEKTYEIKISMTPGQALLRMCSPQLSKTTYESIKEKKEKTKQKKTITILQNLVN